MPDHRAATAEVREAETVIVYVGASALRIGEAALQRAIRNGEMPSIRLGRNVLKPSAAIRSMLGME